VYGDAVPWAQRLLDPARIWPLTTGGVLVAVLGTGVDATNAQFGPGQILAGTDVTPAHTSSTVDCDGRGTFAAGLIAARPDRRTTMTGLAPGARVLPVRYLQATRGGSDTVDPALLAAAIRAAVQARARVICIVVPAVTDSPALRAAVAAARAADALVVSPAVAPAAGGRSGVSYPTGQDGVLAVGAVDQAGAVVSAETGDYLGLAAPGKGLVGTAAGAAGAPGHVWPVDDPGYAAAYVAGAAALVRAYRPELTAAQVRARLEATADRPGTGGHDPRIGWGIVDPYAAVAAEGVDATGSPRPAGPASVVAAARPVTPVRPLDRVLALIALALLGVAVMVALGTATVARGRARGWRIGR
jgi:hypothetical protein